MKRFAFEFCKHRNIPWNYCNSQKIVLGRLLCILGWHLNVRGAIFWGISEIGQLLLHNMCCCFLENRCPGTRLVALKLHQPSKSRGAISWSYSTNRPEEMRLVSTLSRIQNQQVGRNLEMQGSQPCHLQIQPKIIKIPGPRNSFLLKIPFFTKFPKNEKFFRAEACLRALIGTSWLKPRMLRPNGGG